ncbi:MAG: hypothetical protein AAF411_11055 [Myxococcota bacterium]
MSRVVFSSFCFLAVLFQLLNLWACGGGVVAFNATSGAMVTQTDQAPEVRSALARALQQRRFTIESETDGELIARLDHRSVSLRVRIVYSGSDYRIEYLDSVGLDYQVDPETGRAMISRRYPRYIQRLEREIVSELDRPAREAQEAIDAERDHQLALERAETDRQLALAREQNREAERRRRAQTEQEMLRADAAASEAAAAEARADEERLRRQPLPTIRGHEEAVMVRRFRFRPAAVQRQSVSLEPGLMPDPYALEGRAVGRISSRRLGLPDSCPGFWSRQPQHYVSMPRGFRYFRLDAVASDDTTLAIVTPDGQVLCDDDGAGNLNPRLHGSFPAGTYAVYVGTYRRGRRTNYALELSEIAPRRQPTYARAPEGSYAQAPPRAAQPVAPPDCRTELLNQGHSSTSLVHCRGAEPRCAAALLRAGHSPTGLIHCRNVNPACAEAALRNGQSPTSLIHCR